MTVDQRARDSLDTENYLFNLKTEFDYRTMFVKRINQEIAKETTAQAEFEAGSTKKAVSEAVVEWLNNGLTQQKGYLTEARTRYTEE